MPNLIIRQAESATDLDAVRDLCRAYRVVLAERTSDRPEILANYYAEEAYEALLARLPDLHAAPDGVLLVAVLDGAPVGCGMIHRIGPETCEIKRVFTAPEARGQGAAKAIVRAAMDHARALGYREMKLDTMVRLPEAIALYKALGFTAAAPFYDLPAGFEGFVEFYGRALDDAT